MKHSNKYNSLIDSEEVDYYEGGDTWQDWFVLLGLIAMPIAFVIIIGEAFIW